MHSRSRMDTCKGFSDFFWWQRAEFNWKGELCLIESHPHNIQDLVILFFCRRDGFYLPLVLVIVMALLDVSSVEEEEPALGASERDNEQHQGDLEGSVTGMHD